MAWIKYILNEILRFGQTYTPTKRSIVDIAVNPSDFALDIFSYTPPKDKENVEAPRCMALLKYLLVIYHGMLTSRSMSNVLQTARSNKGSGTLQDYILSVFPKGCIYQIKFITAIHGYQVLPQCCVILYTEALSWQMKSHAKTPRAIHIPFGD